MVDHKLFAMIKQNQVDAKADAKKQTKHNNQLLLCQTNTNQNPEF
jgi:hypothetical protein